MPTLAIIMIRSAMAVSASVKPRSPERAAALTRLRDVIGVNLLKAAGRAAGLLGLDRHVLRPAGGAGRRGRRRGGRGGGRRRRRGRRRGRLVALPGVAVVAAVARRRGRRRGGRG